MKYVEYLATCYARDKQTTHCRDFQTLKRAVMYGAAKQRQETAAKLASIYCRAECDRKPGTPCPHDPCGCTKLRKFQNAIK